MSSQSGLLTKRGAGNRARQLQRQGQKVVFTNGVFDVLHRGHVAYLSLARRNGDVLFVGLNSDSSVKRLKGDQRPLQDEQDRAIILLALKSVDYVVIFDEDTPDQLIEEISPDVLVKGSDWKLSQIAGAKHVKSYGGKVRRIRLTKGRSSTKLIRKLSGN